MTLNRNNRMENMKNRYMHQRFINGLLVTLSLISLALLRLQAWTSTAIVSKSAMDLPDMNTRFGGWAYYSWPDMLQVSLLLALTLTAMVALFSLRLSTGQTAPGDVPERAAAVARRPATNLCGNPVSAGMN